MVPGNVTSFTNSDPVNTTHADINGEKKIDKVRRKKEEKE